MRYEFTYDLTTQEKLIVVAFLKSLPRFSIEHYPDWHTSAKAKKFAYHMFYRNNELIAVALVEESFSKTARLQFGPLLKYTSDFVDVVNQIGTHYKNQGFWSLYIQPFGIDKLPTQGFLYRYFSGFDKNSWSTVWVELDRPAGQGISRHHQRDIKNSKKLGIRVSMLEASQLHTFCDGFCEVYEKRGLNVDQKGEYLKLKSRFDMLKQSNLGGIYGAFYNNELIGGAVIVSQGDHKLYVQGYAAVKYRHIPVLYNLFDSLFAEAKYQGYKYFDLGGYNRFVSEKDQIYHINRFKQGFSDLIVDFSPQLHFIFKPLNHQLYLAAKGVKNVFPTLLRLVGLSK